MILKYRNIKSCPSTLIASQLLIRKRVDLLGIVKLPNKLAGPVGAYSIVKIVHCVGLTYNKKKNNVSEWRITHIWKTVGLSVSQRLTCLLAVLALNGNLVSSYSLPIVRE